MPTDDRVKTGVVLDVETTGLDLDRDEIIELGMLRFSFSPEGEVLASDPPFSRHRQPFKPIPAEITRLTGITDEMVAGKAIDGAEVENFVEPAVIVIAQNAGFDRRFVERAFPIFATKAWGCSISDVPWREEGFEGSRLAYPAHSLEDSSIRADADVERPFIAPSPQSAGRPNHGPTTRPSPSVSPVSTQGVYRSSLYIYSKFHAY